MNKPKNEGFFSKVWAGLKAHAQVAEFEANLYPVDKKWNTPKGAEVEYTRFGSGDEVLEVELTSSLGVAAGTTVEVWIEGLRVVDLVFSGKYEKFYLKTKEGDEVPTVELRQNAEIRVGEEVIVTGVFKRD